MDDHPTPAPPGQPCIGPDGHTLEPEGCHPRFRVNVAGAEGLELVVTQAPAGLPCIGWYAGQHGDLVPQPFHVAVFRLYDPSIEARAPFHPEDAFTYADGRPLERSGQPADFPHPQVFAQRNVFTGEYAAGLVNVDHFTPIATVRRLLDTWARVSGPGGPVRIGPGRPPVVTDTTAKAHAARIRTSCRNYVAEFKRHPTQRQLIAWCPDELGFSSLSGFQDHLRQLRQHGYRWPQDFM